MHRAIVDKRTWLVLAAILILGFSLRAHCLTCESLWLDEGISVIWAHMEPGDIIEVSARDVQFPLYIIILHYWVGLLGDSEFALRFLSVIFGTLAVLMTYMVGRSLFDRKPALLATLLVALSQFQICFSQEARPYALMSMLTLLSMYFLINLLRERTHLNTAGYIISSAFLMYTHVFALFIVISQNLYVISACLLSRKPLNIRLRQWFLLQAILALLFIPLAGSLAGQVVNVQGDDSVASWIKPPSISSLLFSFSEYYIPGLLPFLLLWIYVLIRKPSSLKPEMDWSDNRVLLLIWLTIPIAIPFLISHVASPIYTSKYAIGATLSLYFLVAGWVASLKTHRLKYAAILLSIILSLTGLYLYYVEINKDQWRGSMAYLDENAELGDLLLFHAGYAIYGPADYYLERTDLPMQPLPETGREINPDQLKSIREGHDRIWLLLFHSFDDGMIAEYLSETHTIIDHKLYDSMEHLDYLEFFLDYNLYNSIELYLFERQ